MSTKPTTIDTQQVIIDTLRSTAADLADKRVALGMMGYSHDVLEGMNICIRHLLLEANHIEQEGHHDTQD